MNWMSWMVLHLDVAVWCLLSSNQVKEIVDDNITEVVSSIVAAYDSGELQAVIDGDHDAWQKWIKGIGKTFKRKVT